MKEETPEKIVKSYCQHIREEIAQWKDINQNGCNDPFWSDGCNMNLTRNHIIYYQRLIAEICTENQLPLPEEYYLSVPPEVDNYYMANLKQKERVKRIFFQREMPERKRYIYDEQQMSLFSQLNQNLAEVVSMNTGRKIFATVQIVNGEIVIDLGDTANYMTVKGSDGITFIVERNSKEFIEVKDRRYENQNF